MLSFQHILQGIDILIKNRVLPTELDLAMLVCLTPVPNDDFQLLATLRFTHLALLCIRCWHVLVLGISTPSGHHIAFFSHLCSFVLTSVIQRFAIIDGLRLRCIHSQRRKTLQFWLAPDSHRTAIMHGEFQRTPCQAHRHPT